MREFLPHFAEGLTFLYTLVDLVVASPFPLLDDIEDEIDSLEDRLLKRARNEDMHRLLALKRSLVRIRRSGPPHRQVYIQVTRQDFPFNQLATLAYFRR